MMGQLSALLGKECTHLGVHGHRLVHVQLPVHVIGIFVRDLRFKLRYALFKSMHITVWMAQQCTCATAVNKPLLRSRSRNRCLGRNTLCLSLVSNSSTTLSQSHTRSRLNTVFAWPRLGALNFTQLQSTLATASRGGHAPFAFDVYIVDTP